MRRLMVRTGAAAVMATTLLVFAVLTLGLVGTPAQAQGDANIIRIVLGFPPGGNTDLVARILANEASQRLGKTIVIESRPGAGGAIAAESVARARPDGRTLLLATSANAILPALNKNLRYNAFADFEWIGTFSTYPLVVVVPKNSPLRTYGDLIANARKAPDKVSYSSPGQGTTLHLATELMGSAADVKFLHVAYKGEMNAMVDLIGSQVDFSVLTLPTVLPRIRSGDIRAIAVTGGSRARDLPDVPTIAQSGYPKFDLTSWVGLAAPKGTPSDEVMRIHNAFAEAQKLPEIRKQIEATGVDTWTLTPTQTRELMQREVTQWQGRADKAGIVAE